MAANKSKVVCSLVKVLAICGTEVIGTGGVLDWRGDRGANLLIINILEGKGGVKGIVNCQRFEAEIRICSA